MKARLLVRVAVSEIPPLCTPLGSGCGEGSWCPPPGLTGLPIACVPAGPVAIGEPCLAPGDCVANATCIELDGAPVCAALCPSTADGESCETGGTCQSPGTDYSVCR